MLKCCRLGLIFVIQILRCLDWTSVSRSHNTEWQLKKLEILASKYMPHAVHTISIANYGSIDMMYIFNEYHIHLLHLANIHRHIYIHIYIYLFIYLFIYL